MNKPKYVLRKSSIKNAETAFDSLLQLSVCKEVWDGDSIISSDCQFFAVRMMENKEVSWAISMLRKMANRLEEFSNE